MPKRSDDCNDCDDCDDVMIVMIMRERGEVMVGLCFFVVRENM